MCGPVLLLQLESTFVQSDIAICMPFSNCLLFNELKRQNEPELKFLFQFKLKDSFNFLLAVWFRDLVENRYRPFPEKDTPGTGEDP